MPGCSPRGSRHPKSSGSSSLAITIRDMPAKPRLMRLPDGSRPTSARLRFTFPPILGPTGMMYTGYSSTPLLMQADQFQTRLIRDREGCKNEWHVVVKSGAASAGCDVPARSPQKPWPDSSPSAKTSYDNHHENLVMSAKNPVGNNEKANPVVAGEGINRNQRIKPMQNKLPMH